jgi:hypothetical protein
MPPFDGFDVGANALVKQIDLSGCQFNAQNFVRHLRSTRASDPLESEKNKRSPANCVGGDGCGKYTIELHSFFLFYTYNITPKAVIVKV